MDEIQKTELINSIAKTIFSNIPFVGGLLTEVIFDFRGRVKQDRINNFALLLSEYFGHNPIENTEVITSEDFGDLFESVLTRVMLTKSQEKYLHFRDIVVNYIEQPYPDADDTELFLDLVSQLNETALIILKSHLVFDAEFEFKRERRDRLYNEVAWSKSNDKFMSLIYAKPSSIAGHLQTVNELDREFKKLNEVRSEAFYEISEEKFLFYKQILFAKGLFTDKGVDGAISFHPFQNMVVTEFGRKFLSFIVGDIIPSESE
jgi:hypothetical protein